MPFCPDCRVEYLPDVTVCPDCGAKLVDTLPELPDIEWVSLPSVPGIVYAQMIKEVLDREEIPCYIQSLWTSGGLGVISSTTVPGVGVKLFVPKSEYDRALQIQEGMIDHE
jgi:hypothetical protein